MKRAEIIPSVAWFVIGLAVAIVSYKSLKLWRLDEPGPGLMPFILGVSLCVCSFPLIIKNFYFLISSRKPSKGFKLTAESRKIGIVISSLIIYTIFLDKIGFIISTFFLLALLFRFVDYQKWNRAILTALLIIFITHLLFSVFLRVELPYGLLRELI